MKLGLLFSALVWAAVAQTPYDGSGNYTCKDPIDNTGCPAIAGLDNWPQNTVTDELLQDVTYIDLCDCPQPGEVIHLNATSVPVGNGTHYRFIFGAAVAGPGAEFFETFYFNFDNFEENRSCLGAANDWGGLGGVCALDDQNCEFFHPACGLSQQSGDYVTQGTTTEYPCFGQRAAYGGSNSHVYSGDFLFGMALRVKAGVMPTSCAIRVALWQEAITNEPEYLPTTDYPAFTRNVTAHCPNCTSSNGGDVSDGIPEECLQLLQSCMNDADCNAEYQTVITIQNFDPTTYQANTTLFGDFLNCYLCSVNATGCNGTSTCSHAQCDYFSPDADFQCMDPATQSQCGAPNGLDTWPQNLMTDTTNNSVTVFDVCTCPSQPDEIIHLTAVVDYIGGNFINRFLAGVGVAGPGAQNFETIFFGGNSNYTGCFARDNSWGGNGGICTINDQNCDHFNYGCELVNGNYVVTGTNIPCQGQTFAWGPNPMSDGTYRIEIGLRLKSGVLAPSSCDLRVALWTQVIDNEPNVLPITNFPGFVEPLEMICPNCTDNTGGGGGGGPQIPIECQQLQQSCENDPGCNAEFQAALSNQQFNPYTYQTNSTMFGLFLSCVMCEQGGSCTTLDSLILWNSLTNNQTQVANETCGGFLDACLADTICAAQVNTTVSSWTLPSPQSSLFQALYNCGLCLFNIAKTYQVGSPIPATVATCNSTGTTPSPASQSAMVSLPLVAMLMISAFLRQ